MEAFNVRMAQTQSQTQVTAANAVTGELSQQRRLEQLNFANDAELAAAVQVLARQVPTAASATAVDAQLPEGASSLVPDSFFDSPFRATAYRAKFPALGKFDAIPRQLAYHSPRSKYGLALDSPTEHSIIHLHTAGGYIAAT